LRHSRKKVFGLAAAFLCLAGSLDARKQPASIPVRHAFFQGRVVDFVPAHVSRGESFQFGPWNFGRKISRPRPQDQHPNLYIVVPGGQNTRQGFERYSHNCILNWLPKGEGSADWDIYYAFILDPTLEIDFRSEKELLIAAQEVFAPAPTFRLEQSPAFAMLKEQLNISSLESLSKYRHPDGTLPGVLIVPARATVRATVDDPAEPKSAADARR